MELLEELEPVVGELLDRHLRHAKEWFPHRMVPWSRGRDFAADWEWAPGESSVRADVRSSLFVNLLTEDNLPFYFRTLEAALGRDDAWGEWVRRWTAEEGRHSCVIRDYLIVSRAVDPVGLERARMAQVQGGKTPDNARADDALVYAALQELATRIAHHNTGKLIDDPAGYEIMKRVAADENHHYLFYRDLASRALQIAPSAMVLAIERQVREFEMPGAGIVDFTYHAHAIARAGIYDLQIHHDQILVPVVLRHWGLESLTGLNGDAEAARDALVKRIELVGRAGRRLAERRDREPAQPRDRTSPSAARIDGR